MSTSVPSEGHPAPIPVLATGRGWLAVEKPEGMSVHNEPGRDLCSLVSGLMSATPGFEKEIGLDPGYGVHPVHRLDKETSGVILLAVTRDLFRYFSAEFESRRARKQYVAILHGLLEEPEGEDAWGLWSWPLAKGSGGRQDPQGPGPLQPSETRYRTLGHSVHYTMAEIEIHSGRTHQIRRHAKLAGHPVVGDARYGSTRALSFLKTKCGFDRLALHAQALTLRLPGESTVTTFHTPSIPAAMRALFENDRSAKEPRPG